MSAMANAVALLYVLIFLEFLIIVALAWFFWTLCKAAAKFILAQGDLNESFLGAHVRGANWQMHVAELLKIMNGREVDGGRSARVPVDVRGEGAGISSV